MEKVTVLGLSKCSHCDTLVKSLTKEGVPFEFLDADRHNKLADRMEAILKTENYPMIIIERSEGAVYLYRVETLNEAKETPTGYATKIGCTTAESMAVIAKKYIK